MANKTEEIVNKLIEFREAINDQIKEAESTIAVEFIMLNLIDKADDKVKKQLSAVKDATEKQIEKLKQNIQKAKLRLDYADAVLKKVGDDKDYKDFCVNLLLFTGMEELTDEDVKELTKTEA